MTLWRQENMTIGVKHVVNIRDKISLREDMGNFIWKQRKSVYLMSNAADSRKIRNSKMLKQHKEYYLSDYVVLETREKILSKLCVWWQI